MIYGTIIEQILLKDDQKIDKTYSVEVFSTGHVSPFESSIELTKILKSVHFIISTL